MKILLAGDSTVATYSVEQAPMTGWGQVLEQIVQRTYPDISVKNYAKCGATTKSFVAEGIWEQLLTQIVVDDLVLIQFGHNDQKSENQVTPNDYVRNLTNMIKEVRQYGGIPFLCTPVERRQYEDGQFAKTLRNESRLIKKIAKEQTVTVIDLNDYSYLSYQIGVTPEQTKEKFLWFGPNIEDNYPAGLADNTHFSEIGATVMAEYVSQRIISYLGSVPLFSKYYYGACMYPEIVNRETLITDIIHMKKIGMNFARIGEFIWSTLEPEEGVYDLTFLEETLALYQEHEIDVVVCIPTPTPPRWLTLDHPERCIKNSEGIQMSHGSRQHVCTNNHYFRKKAYELTRKIAKVVDTFPNVVGLQLDNEFKCHVDLCYCETCQQLWKEWLRNEYHEITSLNQAWGTVIWSENYRSFSEVVMPLPTPFLHNASLMTAFRRFTTESITEFAHRLCHVIRLESHKPITHNTALGFNLDNSELFAELDVAGFDTYAPASNYPGFTLNLDIWRNIKSSSEFLLLETCTSHAGHLENYIQPHPKNYLQTELFTGFAAGLKSFTFWHFRGHRYGVEQPHSCVVTAWGEPDLGYHDVVEAGEILAKMRPHLAKTTVSLSKIALVYSDEAKRFYNTETGGIYDYRTLITDYYGALIKQGISVEVIQEETDFFAFDLLLMPYIRYISPTLLAKIKQFVAQGGKIIFGPMTGDRTREHALPAQNGLAELGDWLGVKEVVQYMPGPISSSAYYQGCQEELWGIVTGFVCTEPLKSRSKLDCQLLSTHDVIGKGVIDKGQVLYIGAQPISVTDSSFWQELIKNEIAPFDADRLFLSCDSGIVKYRRENELLVQFYLANMASESSQYHLVKEGYLEESKELINGQQSLSAYGMVIISFQK